MRNKLKLISLTLVLSVFGFKSFAQCPYDNLFFGDLTPPGVGMTATTAVAWGGDAYTVSVCAGAQYTFTTCATPGTYDTELTLYTSTGVTVLGYSDDVGGACGNQSTIVWTATFTGVVHLLLDEWPCTNGVTNTTIQVTQNTACGVVVASCVDNDDCAAPQVVPLVTAVQTCVADCNTGANFGPDFAGINCFDFNSSTVWYSVTTGASTATLTVNLTSASLLNPYFAVFTTPDCATYTTINCTQGTAGTAAATVSVSPSTTYLIAVSDQLNAQGNFNLCLTMNDDNSACNTNQTLVVSSTSMGSPLTGPYQQGEVVSFCYTITDYVEFNCNWLQGVVPTFGDCWDPASFNAQGMPLVVTDPLDVNGVIQPCAPGPPCAWAACAGTPSGAWSWFPAGAVNYNAIAGSLPPGAPLPAGWYFLSSYNPLTGACTGGDPTDPDNSYGDGNFPNCGVNTFDYTLCFSLTALGTGCGTGNTDCTVSIKTYADGEIGIWNSIGCTADIASTQVSNLCCTAMPITSALVLYCQGDVATPLSATGTNVLWYTVPTGGVGTPVAPTPSTAVVGSVNYYVTQEIGGCESPRETVTVTVVAPSNAGTNGTITLCSTGASVNLFSSLGGSPAAGGTWTGPSALAGGSLGTYNPATCTPGVYTYTVLGNTPCPDATATVTVTENLPPTASAAGPDQTACTTTGSATLAGNNPASGTGTWTQVSGPASTITTPGAFNSTVTGLGTAGTYTYQWTITNAPCTASSDQISIVVSAPPSASAAGPDQTICTTTGTATLAGNSPAIGAGTWTQVSGPASTITTPGAFNSTVTGLGTAGTYVYQWTITSGPCTATTDQVTITVNAPPTAANAGPDQTICTTTGSVTLAGNSPAVGAGTWTQVSGPASTITTPGAFNTTVTGLGTAGTYVYQWTTTNAPCASTNDQVTITVNAPPTAAAAGPDQTICTSTGSVTLAGNAPAVGTGTWTQVSGPASTITTPGAFNSTVTGMGTAGTYVYQWTTTNAPCASTNDQVTITVNAGPTAANAGPDQTICVTTATVTLAGNSPAIGTGTWTQVSGPASTITTPGAFNSTVTGMGTAGTYVYQWTTTNAPCAPTNDQVTITVNPAPTVSAAGPAITICSTSGIANMSGNAPAVGTGTWSYVSGPVTGTITTPSSPTTTITGLTTPGTYVFQWSIANAPCTPSTSNVTITVNAPPTIANSGAPQTICATSGTVTMAGNAPGVGTASWSQISGPVVGTITTPTSPTTTITGLTTPGAYVFQWSIINPPCNPSTSNVTITVNPAPTASAAGPAQTICSGTASATMAANAATVGTGVWTQVSGPAAGTITSPTSPTTTITGLSTPGVYVFEWTISNAPCAASTSTVSITVNPNPVFAIGAIVNPSGCGLSDGSITLTGLTASTTYTISYNDGATISLGSVTTDASGNFIITGLDAGTYSNFSVTNSFGCTTVVVGPVDPSAPTGTAGSAFTNPTTCGGTDGTITISGLTPGGVYDITYSDGASVITLTGQTASAGGTIVITGLGAGTYSGFSLAQSGCTGSAAGSVTLSDPASPVFTSGATFTNPTTCGGSDGTITISGLLGSTTYTLSYDGPSGTVVVGSITTTAGGTYVITGLPQGAYTNFTITNGAGCTTISTTIVTLTDPPSPTFSAGTTSTNPTTCGGSDGTITITGLNPSTTYIISYDGPLGTILLGSVTTDASGNYVITGLTAGSYFNFSVTLTGCNTTDAITVINLTDPGSPTFSVTGAFTNPSGCGLTDGSFDISGLLPFTTYDFSYDNGSIITVTGTTDAAGNFTVTGLGAGTYTNISVTITGCTSVNSTTITLVDPGGPTFTILGTGTNPTTCSGTDGSITITGLTPLTVYDITYFDGTSTITLTGVTTDASGNYTITGLAAGTYSAITVIVTGCSTVEPTPVTLTDPGAASGFVITGTDPTCSGSDGSITITGLTASTSYTITYDDGTGVQTVTLTTDATGQLVITGLGAGTYTTFTITTSGCTATPATTITLTIAAPQTALAGSDQTICATSVTLAGNAVTAGTGTWTVITGTGTFANANSETTSVTGLTTGTNQYVWTIVNGSCPVSSDTVMITAEAPPTTSVLGADQNICDTITSVTVFANVPAVGTGVWTLTAGTATISNPLADSLIITGINGVVTVTWTISGTGICPPSSDAITITPEPCVTLVVSTGFTPGSDGVNDTWDIPGLTENYPNNRVEIFTRWGAKIFTSDGYTTPWDGSYKGNPMPLGAYFFVIYFNDGVTDPMKGTVTIIR
jgi:gliding motility-associated-like protein